MVKEQVPEPNRVFTAQRARAQQSVIQGVNWASSAHAPHWVIWASSQASCPISMLAHCYGAGRSTVPDRFLGRLPDQTG